MRIAAIRAAAFDCLKNSAFEEHVNKDPKAADFWRVRRGGSVVKENYSMFKRPKPLMFAHSMAFGIDHLFLAWEHEDEHKRDKYYNPLSRELLLGCVIPDFQRPKVWTEDQNRALIESVWRGIPIGTYSVNFSIDKRLPPDLTNILIDGQQRLNALRGYWENEFDFDGYYWRDLTDLDQRHFVRKQFPQQRTDSTDRQEVLDYYNAMNFGGVDHTEEDRA